MSSFRSVNALMESIIGLYKTECVRPGPFHTGPFKTLSDLEYATMAWVDWYNHRRLHATLDMCSPCRARSRPPCCPPTGAAARMKPTRTP
jgi:transposase InsO family protein